MNQPQYKEEWLPITGYENYYQISNFGRLKSVGNSETKKERIRVPYPAPNGYLRLVLCANNKRKTISIHRQVALHFISNPESKGTVNHKDYDKQNNTIENLEWCTIKENVNHGRHFKKPVVQKTKSGEIIRVWSSAWEVQQTLGWFSTLISSRCRGIGKTYKNFKWEFYAS